MRKQILIAACFASIIASGSFLLFAPIPSARAVERNPSVVQDSTQVNVSKIAQIQNMRPRQNAAVVEGRETEFSIDLTVNQEGVAQQQYLVEFETTARISDDIVSDDIHPFVLEQKGSPGEIRFFGTITWFLAVSGTRETATMALYRADRSESGNILRKTPIQSISQNYVIMCDETQFVLVVVFKRAFGLCVKNTK